MPGKPDPRIDRYLAKDRPWRQEMLALRAVLLQAGLDEALKWRSPCYVAHGGNIAILSAFKDYCGVGFFKGALLDDPDGLLVWPGDNSRSSKVLKLHSVEEVQFFSQALEGFLAQAIANEKAGHQVEAPAPEVPLPQELIDAFDQDADLAAAFAALTPGRRRGWLLQFTSAKRPETRAARILKATPKILSGQGPHDH